MYGDDIAAVVVDIGSSYTKAGFAGEDAPKAIFPSVAGVCYSVPEKEGYVGSAPRAVGEDGDQMDIENGSSSSSTSTNNATSNGKKWYSGNVAMRRDNMEILPALENGIIKDWDVTEQLLNHTFESCLRINSKEHPVLMAESNFNTRESREKMTELLFEKYGSPGVFLSKNAVLSAFFQGKYTGIVVDCGGAVTSVVPVCEGYVLQKSIIKSNLAGERLTDEYHHVIEEQSASSSSSSSSSSTDARIKPRYMISRKEISPGEFRVTEINYPNVTSSFKTYMTKDVVRDLKESISKIDISGESTATNLPSIPYELPDGSVLEIGHERFTVPEILFRPSSRKLNLPTDDFSVGLTQMVENCVATCDLDIRKDMALNVIVCGGTSMLPNFPDRLTKEFQELTTALKYRLVPITPERKWSVFIGGSILASLGTFQQMWISKLQYEEHGASVVERKCP